MENTEKLNLADKFTKARYLATINERERLMTLLRRFQINKYELAEKENNEKCLEQAQFLNEVINYLTSVDDECKRCRRYKSHSCFGSPNSCSDFLEE